MLDVKITTVFLKFTTVPFDFAVTLGFRPNASFWPAAVFAFRGKEKFITSGYKEKLKERELWEKEDENQRRQDKESNLTKQIDKKMT